MGEILVGTCGYSYEDWRETLYPPELPKLEFLHYYSLFFPFVELDFTYYSMPSARSMASMAARTPSPFAFAVKTHRTLTHEIGPGWKDDAAAFARALEPLARDGRLACVLVQLPFSFRHEKANRVHLASLCDALSAYPLAVEFRNAGWYTERVFDELERRKLALALVDRPELAGLPPEAERVTAGFSYLRFHGRNAEAWWKGDATSRYDWLYSEEELQGAAARLGRLAQKARVVYAAFNNHARGRAVVNAKRLVEILEPRLEAARRQEQP